MHQLIEKAVTRHAHRAVEELDWLVWLGEVTPEQVAEALAGDKTLADAWARREELGLVIR